MTLRLAVLCISILMFAGSAPAEILIGLTPSLTGPISWIGELQKRAMELAVADLNAKGGVLGEPLRVILVDDQCDADAAALAAKKLVVERVAAVFGHRCSGAAIPASEIYETAGIPMFTDGATSPKLTERGLRYVFRLNGRNDRQAALAADLLSARWGDRPIAVVHDTQVASVGLAEYVRKELHLRGLKEALDEELAQDQVEFADLISRLRLGKAAVLYCACFVEQGGLLVRQLWEAGLKIPVVTGNAAAFDSFWVVAGAEAAQATLVATIPDLTRANIPATDAFTARLRQDGINPAQIEYNIYAGLQAWAQVAERAKSTRGADLAPILHKERFDTVLGTIGFNEKGDAVVGPFDWVWNRWRDGTFFEVLTEPLLRGEIVEKSSSQR
jgi:branched-chain amino acid transport system substrate-binding protein